MSVTFLDKKEREIESPSFSVPLVDTHAHLSLFKAMSTTVALVRAAQTGIRLLVAPIDVVSEMGEGKLFKDAEDCLRWFANTKAQVADELGDDLIDLRFVAGCHPYGADGFDARAKRDLERMLEDENCVGMGEFGFDFGPWAELGEEVQEAAFRWQLALALERNLPIELHLRDPQEGEPKGHLIAERIMREMGIPEAGCDLHCFTSGPEIMEPFVELGCYIAFGGAVTFSRSDAIREAAVACPRDRILSETDCPFMAPVPLRGLECEPAMVSMTVDYLAKLREDAGVVSAEDCLKDLWNNACRFFGLSERALL